MTTTFKFTTYQEPATISTNSYLRFSRSEDMTVGDQDKTMKYDKNNPKQHNHWGQFKLLISEIMFLTYYWDPETIPNPIVVYPGSAAGYHIYLLSQLFESVTFHLYDKHPHKQSAFASNLASRPNIAIFNKYFEDIDINKYKDRNDVFLISDIRNLEYGKNEEDESEEMAYLDLKMQKEWVEKMAPVKAMLKCRLPWKFADKNGCPMLSGVAYKQPWARTNSTELRLVCDSNSIVEHYNYKKVEEIMAYHNNVTRKEKFLNPINQKEQQKGQHQD